MRFTTILPLLFILFLVPKDLKAQDSVPKKQQTSPEIKKAVNNLEKSLKENDNLKIAFNYEILAKGFSDKDDLAKAEEFLLKALDIYNAANNSIGKARSVRSIAKVQELQNKLNAATKNFKLAFDLSVDDITKNLNKNDYNRLKNRGNTKLENNYLNANIALLEEKNIKSEIADTYILLAKLNLRKQDSTQALGFYEKAGSYSKKNSAKTIKIYGEMAKLLKGGKRYEEAITVVEKLLEEAKEIKDYDTQIIQLQFLASVYFKYDNPEKAVEALKESYSIAATNGRTFEARESVQQLVDYYKSVKDDKASMETYENFIKNLDRIILSDHSLTDAKTFRVTEERIRRLESEKSFKDELISRKNTFTYFLLGSVALLLLISSFIIKTLYSIKTKNKEIALQTLRLEMNPHFLFNSLNSVNQFIAQNNELAANKYLTSYSNLMRNTMENSNKDFVTLGNEIENLTKYLELEHLRFKDKFDYQINVDPKLDPDNIWVPNMIAQPHLENAIWHGLRYKEEKGLLKMDYTLSGKNIIITIDDNGIGPTKSNELKTHNQKAHESRGLTNTKERMALLNQLYKTKMDFTMTEKQSPETGTIIKITVPIIQKP
ncbi:histidine kinase [Flavobacterium sp. AG291]|uniref:tetratricopeptide repeat-containing sensor histidine kinase n=1 Tax=Flavobacterium sp. AG291 TaxID=2184000 RepID=UPI000E0BC3DF|nr:histidine kinase [Flavobacterium sp. AG291]RDI06918.1 histidine kinase [Flavobacterium sp. AG291]